MTSDIRQILERMAALEGKLTPVSNKKGLNQQQKDVPQLPALLKPKSISVLKSPTDPKHPFAKYAVGGANESVKPQISALEEAMASIEEDMLGKVKKDLNDYLDRLQSRVNDDGKRDRDTPDLDRLERKVRIDRDLIDKAVSAVQKGQAEEDQAVAEDPTQQDTMTAPPPAPVQDPVLPESVPVKTYTMEDGTTLECCGNERDGFELRRGNTVMPSRFKKLDHADIAVELYKKHRAQRQRTDMLGQDYIEER